MGLILNGIVTLVRRQVLFWDTSRDADANEHNATRGDVSRRFTQNQHVQGSYLLEIGLNGALCFSRSGPIDDHNSAEASADRRASTHRRPGALDEGHPCVLCRRCSGALARSVRQPVVCSGRYLPRRLHLIYACGVRVWLAGVAQGFGIT